MLSGAGDDGWLSGLSKPGALGRRTEGPPAAGSLEEALIPFVFQGAANSCWSQDLLERQEEHWGDDLNGYVYRSVSSPGSERAQEGNLEVVSWRGGYFYARNVLSACLQGRKDTMRIKGLAG